MGLIPWRNKQCESEPTEASPLVGLRQEMDRLMDRFVREPIATWDWPTLATGKLAPPVDVSESPTEVVVRAELPGVDAGDLDVSLSGSRLTISGEKKETAETKEHGYFQQETRYGAFQRSIPLPEGIDPDKIDAHFEGGVLTLKLPKIQTPGAKKVEIKVDRD
jgi:HSP20 family protein